MHNNLFLFAVNANKTDFLHDIYNPFDFISPFSFICHYRIYETKNQISFIGMI